MGKIRQLTIYSKNIPKEMKIAVISDIHLAKNIGQKNLEKISSKIDMAEISHVVIAGDSINNVDDLNDRRFRDQFQRMYYNFSSGKPTIVGYGNHDQMAKVNNTWIPGNVEKLKQVLEEIPNFIVLDNGQKVSLDGIEYSSLSPNYMYYEDSSKMKSEHESPEDYKKIICKYYKPDLFSQNKFSILITHEPQSPIIVSEELGKCFQPNTNLVISGHYHGGMVPTLFQTIIESTFLNKLLETRGLVSPQMQLFPQCSWGVKKIDDTFFLINNPVNTRVETPLINDLYGASATVLTLKKKR